MGGYYKWPNRAREHRPTI
ncbi:unnamed protein product, partial [Vitis vinifera]|uniref:Uncharacterized protein n=1 Tax=Vitis vinifera TaxID=29760 RepID=D7U6L6_VITVI